MKRREFIRGGLAAGAAAWVGAGADPLEALAAGSQALRAPGAETAFSQSVCKWCFPRFSVEELARAAREIGLQSIELLGPEDWPTLKRFGLICALSSAPGPGGIERGFNRIEHHEWLIPAYERRLREAAAAGVPQVICFSGNRGGMDDEQGLENCVKGLQKIVPLAEKLGVTLVMELLNSKIDHKDYMCDHTAWGVELVKRVGSDRFKLLYDIYHMQIMEGDVIRTIRENHAYIAHYHTAGVPGRNEIDDTQELNYPAIMRAIAATGFKGFVAQEFVPRRDPLTSLAEAVRLCAVPAEAAGARPA